MPLAPIPWKWTRQRELAARLAAEDKLSDAAISEQCGIRPISLWRWRKYPEFNARIDQIVAAYRNRIRNRGAAIVENRIVDYQNSDEKLDGDLARLDQVIAERAEKYNKPEIPGGATGIVAVEFKGVGSGDNFKLIPEYPVDTGLLRSRLDIHREKRELRKQVAQELGQWAERASVAGMRTRVDADGAVTVEAFRAMLNEPLNGHGQLPEGGE